MRVLNVEKPIYRVTPVSFSSSPTVFSSISLHLLFLLFLALKQILPISTERPCMRCVSKGVICEESVSKKRGPKSRKLSPTQNDVASQQQPIQYPPPYHHNGYLPAPNGSTYHVPFSSPLPTTNSYSFYFAPSYQSNNHNNNNNLNTNPFRSTFSDPSSATEDPSDISYNSPSSTFEDSPKTFHVPGNPTPSLSFSL